MTVSRALRGLPKVSPGVAALIREKARQMGYESDPWLTRMMTETRIRQDQEYRDTVGFIWTSRTKYGHQEFQGVQRQAAQFRFKVDEFHPIADGISGRRMAQILEARQIRGVILSPPVERHHPHYWLPAGKLACVLIGSSLRNKGLTRVQQDHFKAGVLAVTEVHRHGYSRPGIVLDDSFHERSWRSHAAAMAAFSPHSADLSEALWLSPDPRSRSQRSFFHWYRRFKPDVLLIQNADTAVWIESIGLKLPQDVPAVLLAKDAQARRWAGVSHNGCEIGEEAMKALAIKMLSHDYGKSPRSPVITIQGDWMPGESLVKRNAKA